MADSSIWGPGNNGIPGPPGPAATIEVGTVSTGDAGSSASVINSGSSSAAVFDFIIPRGNDGIGIQGPPGPQGQSIQGPQGIQGIQGIPGPKGSTIIAGSGIPPTATGVDGDYFLDQTNAYLYGPKAGGFWTGTFIDLRGGASGVNYGQRAITNNATVIAKTAAVDPTLVSNTDYTQVSGIFAAIPDGINRGITQQINSLTIARAGAYEIQLWASLSSSSNNVNVAFKFAVNGVISLVRRPIVRLDVANNIGSVCANGLVNLAVGDIVTLWLASTVTTNVRIYDAVFSLKELR